MKFTNPGQRSKIPSLCHYPLLKNCKLSSKELSEEQIKFLSTELKFMPTPKKNVCKEINADIQSFCTTRGKQESSFSDTEESLAKKKINSS